MQPTDHERQDAILNLINGNISFKDAAAPAYGVSRATMSRHLKRISDFLLLQGEGSPLELLRFFASQSTITW